MYKEKIKKAFVNLDIELTEQQLDSFQQYYNMLIEWNQVMNLTAITEFDEVLLKHFVDSVAVCKIIDMNAVDSMIDVGTGAGFPGIPIKIVFPHIKVTLLDSLNKRVQFLNAVSDKIGLSDIQAVHGRAEEFGQNPTYREQYDLCVSRAVANLSTLSEYCIPFVKVGGLFVSYKAGEVEEEVNAAEKAVRTLHSTPAEIRKLELPDSEIVRAFILIRKKGKLDKKYPRKAGTPAKNPL